MSTPMPEAKRMRVTANGAGYSVRIAGNGPPLLLLHGFTGSAESWAPLTALSKDFRTIAVDLLGHGQSDTPADPSRYTVEHAVADLLVILDRVLHPIDEAGTLERFGLIGYSMGGRVALRLALAIPERVAVLVLESASPGIEDPEERARRVRSDTELAAFTEQKGVAAFTRRWEAMPLFASQQRLSVPARAHLRDQRMRNSPRGLANSLRGMGTGMAEPLHDRLGELTMPALLIAGELDSKYAEQARLLRGLMPDARVEIVPDAGHTVHLEQPEPYERSILGFFGELAKRSAREQIGRDDE